MNRFLLITLNHKSADLETIGKFVRADESTEFFNDLKQKMKAGELFYLSTCNRIILLLYREQAVPYSSEAFAHQQLTGTFIKAFIPEIKEGQHKKITHQVKIFKDIHAIGHLFSVTASLDSMLVGEREIMGQMWEAYEKCNSMGITGPNIKRVVQKALENAKKVFTETSIGEKPTSIASVAAKEIRSRAIKNSRILFVGAGKTNLLLAKVLMKQGFSNFTIFNRSVEKAASFSEITGSAAHPLAELPAFNKDAEILVTCTGASEPVITSAVLKSLLAGNKSLKLIIDLAVPADVCPQALPLPKPLRYIGMNEIKNIIERNKNYRENEMDSARIVLLHAVADFKNCFTDWQATRKIKDFPLQAKNIRSRALDKVFQKDISGLDAPSREILLKVVDYMENKFIGLSMMAVKEGMSEKR